MPSDFLQREVSSTPSNDLQAAVDWLLTKRPKNQNHWPALGLSLIAQAELLLEAEGVDSLPDVFVSNAPQESTANGRVVNTLNFTRSGGDPVTLRPLYNRALQVIRNEMLRDHPSNAAHATQSWRAYRELIQYVYAIQPSERHQLAEFIWSAGVLARPEIALAEVRDRVVRPFEFVLLNMPTSGIVGVRGGAMLQGIAYGYFRADSPNLILETHKVNTGSSRAGRLGDIDGFRGGEPELAAEVKDLVLDENNAHTQLADFIEDMATAPNATAVVVCRGISDKARNEIESRNIIVLAVDDLVRTVKVWDLPKQQEGLRGVDYYLSRIQRSGPAQDFFRKWLADHDLDAGFNYPEDDAPPKGDDMDEDDSTAPGL